MELCFIGGGHFLKGELDEVFEELSKRIKPNANIVVVPFATDISKYDSWMSSLEQGFANISNVGLTLLHEDLSKREMISRIDDSDALYLIGGRTEKLLEIIEKKELAMSIKSYPGLLIGYSAGALAFCKGCILTKDEDYPESLVIKGLGLVDFSVEVHYNEASDDDLMSLSNERTIYALPDGSSIFYKDGRIHKKVNDVISFLANKKTIV
ncbi:Type 1 glutamine amidotransferase-like domain-containing protein [Psychrobacillus sp. OK028]|uniref:Type 1 glutamine amidotransferase-like domain-containing protein n=1 Tax=Psychrobacillus sp. OK028 TaxID=1884359 RepID=UPI001587889F|nr:Type 1 glutamine amidotransferase-like domain-containing protein [Psychrobacillus sp. OK028]